VTHERFDKKIAYLALPVVFVEKHQSKASEMLCKALY